MSTIDTIEVNGTNYEIKDSWARANKASISDLSNVAFSGSYADLSNTPPASKFFRLWLNADYTVNRCDADLNYESIATYGATGAQIFIGAYSAGGCLLMFEGLGHHNDTGTPAYIFSTTINHVDDPNYMRTLIVEVRQGAAAPVTSMYTNEKVDYKLPSTDGWHETPSELYYPTEKLVKTTLDSKASQSSLSDEESARIDADEELSQRISRLESTVNYYLLYCGTEQYINPSTLQPVSGRYYQSTDFANNEIGDINIKAWLEYKYGFHDVDDLISTSLYVFVTNDGEQKYQTWDYWPNLVNTQISSYPNLQQLGEYIYAGSDTISPFTNSSSGTIKGSTTDGYVQSDGGLGKVTGWDIVKSDIESLKTGGREPATATPKMDGVAAVGTSIKYAREDHVHPSDTAKEAVSNKVSSWSGTTSNTTYPSEKLVKDALNGKKNSDVYYTASYSDSKSFISTTATKSAIATCILNGQTPIIKASCNGKEILLTLEYSDSSTYYFSGNESNDCEFYLNVSSSPNGGAIKKEFSSRKVTSWSSATSDTNYPSEKLVKTSLDAKENISNKVSSWSSTTNNTRYPTEKLVKDSLDTKENVSNKVSSWSSSTNNTRYPGEKLVKDSLDTKENVSNKKTSVVSNSTSDTYYPSTKAVYDEFMRKPVVVYDRSVNGGSYTGQQDHPGNCSWQLTGLDLTPYRFVKCYVKMSDLAVGSSYSTASVVVTIPLFDSCKSTSHSYFMGSSEGTNMADRKVHYACTMAISGDKTKWMFCSSHSVAGSIVGARNNDGRYLARIEGYY